MVGKDFSEVGDMLVRKPIIHRGLYFWADGRKEGAVREHLLSFRQFSSWREDGQG